MLNVVDRILQILIIMEYKDDYKSKILNKLEDLASGLTTIKLSKKVKFHRNIVTTYLSILEVKGLVKNMLESAVALASDIF